MSLPGSSTMAAEDDEITCECRAVRSVLGNAVENNLLPRQIMTRKAFEMLSQS